MNDKVEVKSLILLVGGKEIKLTIGEARALFGQLGDLFGKPDTIVLPNPYPVYVERWPTYPAPTPIWVDTTGVTGPQWTPTTYCESNFVRKDGVQVWACGEAT